MSLRDSLRRSPSGGSHNAVASSAPRYGRYLRPIARVERELWLLTATAMLADVALTVYGLQIGLEELNPVAQIALASSGAFGLLGLKLAALLVGVCTWWLAPSRYAPIVPLGLATPTAFAVVSNAVLVSVVLF
ncbi:DUF5658 family protein [Halobacteriales archaeon Cl-PHB]